MQANADELGVLDIQLKLSPLEDVYLAVVGHPGATASDNSSNSSSAGGSMLELSGS